MKNRFLHLKKNQQNHTKLNKEMSDIEKATIIGYFRNGTPFKTIGFIMGISAEYAEAIVTDYLKTNP